MRTASISPEQAARERRYEDAAAIWGDLAKAGHAEAQYHLASLYRTGRGVAADHERAVVLFRLSAESGNRNAQYSLGTMYQNGWGTAPDPAAAIRWYRKAAERGHASAAIKLREIRTTESHPAAPARFNLDGNDPTADLARAPTTRRTSKWSARRSRGEPRSIDDRTMGRRF